MLNKIIKASHYLKLFALVVIMSGFAVSAAVDPIRLSDFFGSGSSKAIGVNSSVNPNPYNTLALQLNEKEGRLEAQEIELKRREDAFDEKLDAQKKWVYFLSAVVSALFLLVVANFYFDLRRKAK